MSRRFQINAPGVVSEVIDGEAVIMNLQSGHYFSTGTTGAYVWTLLERGRSDSEIVAALASRYGIPEATASAAVTVFVDDVLQHELMVDRTLPVSEGASEPSAPAGWSPPALNVFTDMEDLLLLDPIHDVSEAGWPMPKSVDEQA